MMLRHSWPIGGVVVIVSLLLAGACGPGTAPAGQPPMAVLTDQTLETMRAQFNQAAGETRLVLLLSPT